MRFSGYTGDNVALSKSVQEKLIQAKQSSKKEILGLKELPNDAHAEVLIGIIKAFGDKPDGFIYVEANIPKRTYRPADIILCDPDTGVVVIEVKGYLIDCIKRIIAGTKLHVYDSGMVREISPWAQARDAMFAAQNEFKRRFSKFKMPCFVNMVAFPNILKDEFVRRFGKDCISKDDVLFREDFADIRWLKIKLTNKKIRHGENRDETIPIEIESIERVKAVFGDSAVLYKEREYRKVEQMSLGYYIDELELMDKYLSKEQQELSDLSVDGKPRLIRGVAGSGKTVVLANIIAKYINQLKRQGKQSEFDFEEGIDNKDIKIAVICYNKTLVPLLKEKIELSYKSQTGKDFKWDDSVCIGNFDSFLKKTLVKEGIINKNIWEIGDPNDRSQFLSEEWEKYKNNSINWDKVTKFDTIFIDEGQDLSEDEYILLKDLLKSSSAGEQNIIIFYDDAQNVYGRKRPNWSNIGINITPDRSRVMKDCFRNTKQIINLAYNVLLGSCAPDNVRVNTSVFADYNYLKNLGLVEEKGGWILVKFAEREGPAPVLKTFSSIDEEIIWVAESVKILIEKEQVLPEDILIISCMRKYCDRITEKIKETIKGISKIKRTYVKEEKSSYIFEKNVLTISTVHSAKGYDAGVVFFAGLHDLSPDIELDKSTRIKSEAERRAIFYVGATRAKYKLYLSGAKIDNYDLLQEIEKTHKLLSDQGVYK